MESKIARVLAEMGATVDTDSPPITNDATYNQYLGTFREAMAKRLRMRNDGVPGMDTCNCEPTTRAIIKTCWDSPNRGRRMLTCSGSEGKKCGFLVWLDSPFTGHKKCVVDHLYETIEQLVFEDIFNCTLELQDDMESNAEGVHHGGLGNTSSC